jgi:hypothetical protein
MPPNRPLHAVACLVAAGMGCTTGGGGGLGGPGGSGISQIVGPSGAEISISAAGDPTLAGTTLLIPAGALPAATLITVAVGANQAAIGETPLGPSVRFTPDGLQFAKPATLTLPYVPAEQPARTAIAVAVTTAGRKSESSGGMITVDATAGTVALDIMHFTDYQVLATPAGAGVDGGVDGGHDGGVDGGPRDGGVDGGLRDGGVIDGGPHDGGLFDGGGGNGFDGGIIDGGGPIDGGIIDGGGPIDGGIVDAAHRG